MKAVIASTLGLAILASAAGLGLAAVQSFEPKASLLSVVSDDVAPLNQTVDLTDPGFDTAPRPSLNATLATRSAPEVDPMPRTLRQRARIAPTPQSDDLTRRATEAVDDVVDSLTSDLRPVPRPAIRSEAPRNQRARTAPTPERPVLTTVKRRTTTARTAPARIDRQVERTVALPSESGGWLTGVYR